MASGVSEQIERKLRLCPFCTFFSRAGLAAGVQ